jgi:hypothetical protein
MSTVNRQLLFAGLRKGSVALRSILRQHVIQWLGSYGTSFHYLLFEPGDLEQLRE